MRSAACLRAFWYAPQKSASWTQLTATFSDENPQKSYYWMVKAERFSAYANALKIALRWCFKASVTSKECVVSILKVCLHPKKHMTG
jgi:hypothetical protein